MELQEALRRRRMVRRYDPDAPVPDEALQPILDAGLRAPSAGYTQAVSLLVLRAEERARFWAATTGHTPSHTTWGTAPDAASGSSSDAGTSAAQEPAPNRWLAGMRAAPVLVTLWTSREAYLDRYAEPDKGWKDRDLDRWSAPYWYVDAGMAAMAMLLSATDRGLGACFFGVPADRIETVRAAFGVPVDQLSVGVVSLGRPAAGTPVTGSATRRPRRPSSERVYQGRWADGL